jgi:large subunit ribosomal protein L23
MNSLALKPRMSEKAYATATGSNVYVFIVPGDATKQSISTAVKSQFGVTVVKVRTVVQNGKAIRSRTKRTRGITVNRSDIKKAYVTVKQDDHIAIFDAPEDSKTDKKSDKKEAKADKKSDKKASKKSEEKK